MSELYELPNGWEWKKLIDVCEFINGKAYKKEELLNMGKYPVLRVGNFFTNNNWYYSDLELPENKYCDKGDLLYAWSASFGPKIWDGEKSIYHYHIWKLIPNYNFISKQYLYWLLDWDVEQIKSDQGTGTTMMHVTKGSMESRIVPIPKLSEQQRIVSKLDLLFNKIDKSIELHQKNMDEANAFMGSILDEVFVKLGESHPSFPLTKYVKFSGGSQPPKSEFSDIKLDGYVRLIQIRDYKSDNYIIYVNEKSIRKLCDETDIMIGRYGPPVFQILRGISGAYNVALMKAEIDEDYIHRNYLYVFLQNPNIQNYIIGLSQRSAGQSGVNKDALEKYPIPIPPLSIQQNVVEYLDSVSEKMEKVKSIQKEKMETLKALKASILDKAFRGEL